MKGESMRNLWKEAFLGSEINKDTKIAAPLNNSGATLKKKKIWATRSIVMFIVTLAEQIAPYVSVGPPP